jgi:sigma-B regulation protein RsbU (phosphoserine phosphatase)
MTTTPPPPTAAKPLRVLLVDDQAIVGETIRRMLAGEADVEFHYCADPAEALTEANRIQPTVILQDLVMPDIDGLQLVKFYRANPATRETPMIVLSSKEEPATKAKAFGLGANDYLVKLPDQLELVARVRYHSRAYLSRLERDEAFRRLAESQQQLADEVGQAARYVRSLLPAPLKKPVAVDWRFVPSTQLGGDMFGYRRIDKNRLAIYLLDVSGHGVGSSLLAVSAANLLSAGSLPDTDFSDPGGVVARLNDVFQMDRQNGKYFTIFYGVLDRAAGSIAYCNAAHPAGLLFDANGAMTQLDTTDPLVGMLPPGTPFESKTVPADASARLLVYSDGVFEIERPDDSMWTHREFLDFVVPLAAEPHLMDRLTDHVRAMRGADTLNDDFSILDVRWIG